MSILTAKQSLIKMTSYMEKKEKFAYINVSKGSVISLNKNSDRPFPSPFAKAVLNSMHTSAPNYMKGIAGSIRSSLEQGSLSKIGLPKEGSYLYSNVFENYYEEDKDTYSTIVERYFKSSPQLVVTLNDPRIIQKNISYNSHIIPVKFSNMYEKLDAVYNQITEFEGGVDYCIMDCGVLGLALAGRVFKNLNMSVVDMGKTITMVKSDYARRKAYEASRS